MTKKMLKIDKVEKMMKKLFPDASNWKVEWKYDNVNHETGQYRKVRCVNGNVTQSAGYVPETDEDNDQFRRHWNIR